MSVGAVQRLRDWPEVVDLPWLCRHAGWTGRQASVYVARWQQQGWLAKAGPRAGMYYNLVASGGEVTLPMRLAALQMAHPSAVMMGESVLHQQGWTTQVPQAMSVAVWGSRVPAALDGFTLHPRPRRWFTQHHDTLVAPDEGLGLRALAPAAALVDLYTDPQAWHPDPDDLDLDAAAMAALQALPGGREGWPAWLNERIPVATTSRRRGPR